MPAVPQYIVRRSDGRDAGAIFDLPHQRKVCLHVEDEELVRLLAVQGIMPPRPPLLDAGGHNVRGAYAERPQRNWFFAPPIESVAATLQASFAPAGYAVVPI